ncbi:MAG: HYR domain-containing protein, partial [Saprospiraceae bacterium]
MKQKPVFLKHLTCIVSIASLLIPAANILQLNSILFSNEGNHPKNVVLHSPDAITCMDPKTFYVGSDCMAEVLDTVPKSNGTITSLSYSINGGSTVALTSPFPATISLGLRRIDTVQIVWQVQDNLGANATCTHIKYVRDTISPIIICPTNITVGTDNDGRRAALRNPLTTVDFGPPTFSDNCGSTDLVWVNNHTGTKDTIGRFPIGTTTVCWTVRDASLNSVECCHTVTVVDNVRPVIVCPDTIKTQCSLLPIYANFAQFSAAGGYATDDVKLDTMSFRRVRDITIDSTCLYRKTIHRQYTISDSTGNADTCFQVIVMRDTTPPTPVCKDITIDLNSAGNASITADQLNNNSTDNCGGTLIFTSMPSNLFFSCNDVSTSPVPITLIVTDLCGNSATCRANVTVRDLVLPTITCPANITIDANINQCFTTNVTLGNPSAQDNCPPVTGIVPYFNGNIFSGSTQLPVGTNTIIWIVTDKNNNTNSCSQQVTVKDNTSPTITCPANITLTAPTGTCAAIVNYTPPSGNDACLGASTVLVSGLASGSMFPVGVTTNIFRVTDISGNSATCSFTVNVIDSQLPIITCPPNITVTAPTTTCSAL